MSKVSKNIRWQRHLVDFDKDGGNIDVPLVATVLEVGLHLYLKENISKKSNYNGLFVGFNIWIYNNNSKDDLRSSMYYVISNVVVVWKTESR